MSKNENEHPSLETPPDQTTTPAPLRLGSLVLYTADLQRTIAFYRLFGLTFVPEQHGSGPLHYSTMLGETLLEIYPASSSSPSAEARVRIGLLVVSIENTLKHGGLSPEKPVKPSPYGRFVTLTDPDGRTIELRELPTNAPRTPSGGRR
jgi:lactoylglutathione lyase